MSYVTDDLTNKWRMAFNSAAILKISFCLWMVCINVLVWMMCVGKRQETRDKRQNKQFHWTGLNLWWYDDTVVFTMCEEPVLVVELWL